MRFEENERWAKAIDLNDQWSASAERLGAGSLFVWDVSYSPTEDLQWIAQGEAASLEEAKKKMERAMTTLIRLQDSLKLEGD